MSDLRFSEKSIDKLMLSYANLSEPTRASSFKGPALKDVKVDRCEEPGFKPSAKARDWSTFSPKFEEKLSGHKTQFSSSPSNDFFSGLTQVSSVQNINGPDDDEWGDFQTSTISASLSIKETDSFKASQQLRQSESVSSAFPSYSADFFKSMVTENCIPLSNHKSYKSDASADNSSTSGNFRSQDTNQLEKTWILPSFNNSFPDDDDFSDFVSAPRINSIEAQKKDIEIKKNSEKDMTPSNRNLKSILITTKRNKFDLSGIAATLAASNENASKTRPSSTYPLEIDGSSSNSDIVSEFHNIMPSQPSSFSQQLVSGHNLTSHLVEPSIVSDIKNNQNDRYSELRDIFELFQDPSSKSIETTNEAQKDKFHQDSLSANYEANNKKEFGIFHHTTASKAESCDRTSAVNDVSFPNSEEKPSCLELNSKISKLSHSTKRTEIVPWLPDEPPALVPYVWDLKDQRSSLDVHSLSALNTFNDSSMFDESPDPSFQKTESIHHHKPQMSTKSPSCLSLSGLELNQPETSELSTNLPSTLAFSSPNSSLHLSEEENSTTNVQKESFVKSEGIITHRRKESSHEWIKIVTKVQEIFLEAYDAVRPISDFATLNDIFEADLGASYLKNLHEIRRMFCRIQLSLDMHGSSSSEALRSLMENADSSWNLFLRHARCPGRNYQVLIQNTSFGNEIMSIDLSLMCFICWQNLNIIPGSDEDMNNATVVNKSLHFHAACANFWLNCIDPVLPDTS